jgi:16S rRNA (cytosine1402-N4)-methyltransferase
VGGVSEVAGARHEPVLSARVLELFDPACAGADAVLVDATIGPGGHSAALLECYPRLRVVGLDRDSEAIAVARRRLAGYGGRFSAVHARYDELGEVFSLHGLGAAQGVLFDLGASSLQLDAAERGFAYARDAPLDMRMDTEAGGITAAEVLNTYSYRALRRILRDYGEERFASRIAAAVLTERERGPFETSGRLVRLLYDTLPAPARRAGGHPAKRTFQALRIEVNSELDVLRTALPAACARLAVGGRVVALAYHSLEDRIVKRALAGLAAEKTPQGLPVELPGHGPEFRVLTRGAEQAGDAETRANPRAASVRLRAAERVKRP